MVHQPSNTPSEEAIRVEELVESVESLSRETNVLAINACVEAARTGEKSIHAEEILEMTSSAAETAGEILERLDEIKAAQLHQRDRLVHALESMELLENLVRPR